METTLHALSETVETAIPMMTFEERWHLLELLRIRVEIVTKDTVRLTGVISEAIVDFSPA